MATVSNKKNGLVFKVPLEHQIQAAVVDWAWNRSGVEDLKWLYSIRNGFGGGFAVAGKAKREGLNSGVPDLHLPLPRWGFNSLWVEMKRPGGELSVNQEKWRDKLKAEGCAHFVCFAAHSAQAALLAYAGFKSIPGVKFEDFVDSVLMMRFCGDF